MRYHIDGPLMLSVLQSIMCEASRGSEGSCTRTVSVSIQRAAYNSSHLTHLYVRQVGDFYLSRSSDLKDN